MAKRITNPIEIIVRVEDGIPTSSAHYGVACDDGLHERRGVPVTLRPTTINDILEETMPQINAEEEIRE